MLRVYNFLVTDFRFTIEHRCVTPLYRIPLGIFNCVADGPYVFITSLYTYDFLQNKISASWATSIEKIINYPLTQYPLK